jgi:hypothetical protein
MDASAIVAGSITTSAIAVGASRQARWSRQDSSAVRRVLSTGGNAGEFGSWWVQVRVAARFGPKPFDGGGGTGESG